MLYETQNTVLNGAIVLTQLFVIGRIWKYDSEVI
jgi:hypothetical protein